MEADVFFALLLISSFALLGIVRAFALIGRRGVVHYRGPGIEQAARDQRRLEGELGVHNYANN
jgi:hypothetical protein